jgi:hypothetical protein
MTAHMLESQLDYICYYLYVLRHLHEQFQWLASATARMTAQMSEEFNATA